MKKYIAALDQGTTSSRTIIFDKNGNIVAKSMKEFPQCYPKPGWVEHDPREILASQAGSFREALKEAGIGADELAGLTCGYFKDKSSLCEQVCERTVFSPGLDDARRAEKLLAWEEAISRTRFRARP